MEKKVKIIVAAAAAVVVVAAIAIFFALKGGGKSLDEYLDLGAKYLEEQDYDKAIEAYTEALKIDDMSVEAYLGLADAYVCKGDIEKAKEVLQTGYDKTGDERLLDKLNNLGSGAGNGDNSKYKTVQISGVYGAMVADGSKYFIDAPGYDYQDGASHWACIYVNNPITMPDGEETNYLLLVSETDDLYGYRIGDAVDFSGIVFSEDNGGPIPYQVAPADYFTVGEDGLESIRQ